MNNNNNYFATHVPFGLANRGDDPENALVAAWRTAADRDPDAKKAVAGARREASMTIFIVSRGNSVSEVDGFIWCIVLQYLLLLMDIVMDLIEAIFMLHR